MSAVNKSIYTSFFTDKEGNIVSIKQNNEQNQISSLNYTVQLKYLPEEFNRVVVVNKDTGEVLHEVNNLSALEQGMYYVDYNTGVVSFSSEDAGKVCLFNYYGLGYELISCARIFDQSALESNGVIRTIQDIINGGQSALDYLNTVGDGVALINNLKAQVETGKTTNTTLQATVDEADTLNSTLESNITTATNKNKALVDNLATVDSKNSALTTSINNATTAEGKLNTTIDTATSKNTTLNNTISKGNTLKTNLDSSITTGNQVLSDLNTAIQGSDLASLEANVTDLLHRSVVVGTVAELTTAISNIGRSGYSGSILMKAGTYAPSGSFTLPAYTSIRPLGDGRVTIKCNNASLNNVFRNKLSGTETGYNGAGYITIEGITFEGNNTTNTITPVAFAHARGCTVSKCKFQNFNRWHNIELNGCNFCYIKNNEFKNYGNTDSSNATEVIQLDYCGNSEVYPWTCKYDNTVCKNIYIEENSFDNIIGAGVGNHSFLTNIFIDNLHIKKNVFTNCTHAVYIGNINNLYFDENHCEGCRFGIEIKEGSGQGISGFTFRDNYFYGLKGTTGYTNKDEENRFIRIECLNEDSMQVCSGIKILYNTIKNCNSHGVGIFGNHVECIGNMITDCGKIGIFFYCVQVGRIDSNICQNNGSYNQGWRNYDIAVGGYSGNRNCWRVGVANNSVDSICGLNGCTNSNYAIGNTVDCTNVNGGAMVQK